jgi:2-polyprenyl-3-methyl-5-hydroxy-6-metoxy-1,4-benzoquinol methylase
VLDIGCGNGSLAQILNKRGYRIIGIDNDPSSLHIACQSCNRVIETDIERWDFDIGLKFDYIILADVIEHLCQPLEVMQKLIALLQENGTIIISVPNVAHLSVRLMLLFGRWDYSERGILDKTHYRFFTLLSLKKIIAKAKFHIIKTSASCLPWSIILNSKMKFLSNIIGYIDRLAIAIWPTLFAYQWIIVSKKKRED